MTQLVQNGINDSCTPFFRAKSPNCSRKLDWAIADGIIQQLPLTYK